MYLLPHFIFKMKGIIFSHDYGIYNARKLINKWKISCIFKLQTPTSLGKQIEFQSPKEQKKKKWINVSIFSIFSSEKKWIFSRTHVRNLQISKQNREITNEQSLLTQKTNEVCFIFLANLKTHQERSWLSLMKLFIIHKMFKTWADSISWCNKNKSF